MSSIRVLWVTLVLVSVVTVLNLLHGCTSGSSDDDDDESGQATCPIDPDANMFEVTEGFSFDVGGCGSLDMQIVLDKLFVNANKNLYEIRGQHVINNDNMLYLRGAGLSSQESCYAELAGVGTFMVRTEFLECTTDFILEIVASVDGEAQAFCEISIYTGLECEIDDDDSDDDDSSDDDAYDDCLTTLGTNVEDCFSGLTGEEVCADPDADCWVACFNASETCGEWQTCLEVTCGVVLDDDSDDDLDDDSSGNAPVLSNGFWDPDVVGGDNKSTATWDVCDEDNDLSGGQIFFWIAGTTDPFLAGDVFWDDLDGGAPSASDCGNPPSVGLSVDFTGAPSGTYCCDIEATDGSANLSNKLTNLCLTMP